MGNAYLVTKPTLESFVRQALDFRVTDFYVGTAATRKNHLVTLEIEAACMLQPSRNESFFFPMVVRFELEPCLEGDKDAYRQRIDELRDYERRIKEVIETAYNLDEGRMDYASVNFYEGHLRTSPLARLINVNNPLLI